MSLSSSDLMGTIYFEVLIWCIFSPIATIRCSIYFLACMLYINLQVLQGIHLILIGFSIGQYVFLFVCYCLLPILLFLLLNYFCIVN